MSTEDKKVFKINNLNEFITLINDKELKDYYFRGENKKYPKISSSLLRNYKSMMMKNHSYEELVNEYYREIAASLGELERNDFLAFSQHHGLATNLIDFTNSPLVALFFSCNGFGENLKDNIGYIYLIDKKNTIDISKLIKQKCAAPSNNYNLIDLFICQDAMVVEFFWQSFISYFLYHDIEPYIEDANSCCNEIMNALNFSTCKNFLNELGEIDEESRIDLKSDVLVNLIKKYFPKLGHEHISHQLSLYLTLLHVYLVDLCDVPIHKEIIDLRFPKIPYFIYKTPYKFDRIRNQEGVFLYQFFNSYPFEVEGRFNCLQVQEIIPDITIEIHNQNNILKELDFIGINSKFIYGDYDNIAQYINSAFF